MKKKGLTYGIRRCLHITRFFLLSLKNKEIRVSKSSYFYPSVKCEIAKNASLNVSNGVLVSKGSFIGVRDGASLSIGNTVYINRNVMIVAHKGISIGSNVTIGPYCCFFDHDHKVGTLGGYVTQEIVIEDNVWIGASVIILKGVHIGANSVVAAGSVVTKDIPKDTLFIQKRQEVFKSVVERV